MPSELLQKRNAAVERMKELRDKIMAAKTPEERKQLKADFDKAADECDRLNEEINVENRTQAEIERRMNGEGRGPGTPGLDDVLPGEDPLERRQRRPAPEGMIFRDEATGREIRSVVHGQTMPATENERAEDAQQISVGRCLEAVLCNRTEILNDAERRAMLGGLDAGGGYLLNPTLSARVIDLARSASVVSRAGAQTIPMDSGELHLAQITGDPTAHWRPESVKVRSSDISLARLTLRPKTVAAIVPLSIELIEDAQNIAQIVENGLRQALGLALDRAALRGAGAASEPLGIRNHPGVNTLAVTDPSVDYDDIVSAIGDIMGNNYPEETTRGLSWIRHPRDAEHFEKLKDGQGRPIIPGDWAREARRFQTTSLPIDEGAGADSVEIVGAFQQQVIGMRTRGVTIRVLDSGQVEDSDGTTWNAASQLMRLVVAYMRADVALLRPDWFTVLTGCKVL